MVFRELSGIDSVVAGFDPNRAIVLLDRKGDEFVVNGQRIKHYLTDSTIAEGEEIPLSDPPSA